MRKTTITFWNNANLKINSVYPFTYHRQDKYLTFLSPDLAKCAPLYSREPSIIHIFDITFIRLLTHCWNLSPVPAIQHWGCTNNTNCKTKARSIVSTRYIVHFVYTLHLLGKNFVKTVHKNCCNNLILT